VLKIYTTCVKMLSTQSHVLFFDTSDFALYPSLEFRQSLVR